MSARLEKHAIRWRMAQLEWPIYDDEYPYDQIGVITEDEWKWADLTSDEQAKLRTDATLLAMDSADRTPDNPITDDFALAYTLSHRGIACFHRWHYSNDSRDVPFMRSCSMCMVSEPLPGEVYRVGDGWMRLTDRPRRISVPRPPERPEMWVNDPNLSPIGPAIPIDEYEWNGRAYVKV